MKNTWCEKIFAVVCDVHPNMCWRSRWFLQLYLPVLGPICHFRSLPHKKVPIHRLLPNLLLKKAPGWMKNLDIYISTISYLHFDHSVDLDRCTSGSRRTSANPYPRDSGWLNPFGFPSASCRSGYVGLEPTKQPIQTLPLIRYQTVTNEIASSHNFTNWEQRS